MKSHKKPPLPSGTSVIGKRPEIFCLNYFHTKKECDEYNRKTDENSRHIWDSFHRAYFDWKS